MAKANLLHNMPFLKVAVPLKDSFIGSVSNAWASVVPRDFKCENVLTIMVISDYFTTVFSTIVWEHCFKQEDVGTWP